jgi:hypothetical protein
MKINSELPNCLLDRNNELNEYDFVLFHLYESDVQYKEYYLSQRRLYPDRLMIFDNSAYEYYVKGETLDLQLYYEAICELAPDYYILPDVLMDKEKTIRGVEEFLDLYEVSIGLSTGKSQPLAVAQGMTEDDLIDCLDMYKRNGIRNIAIPFHNRFFKTKSCVVPTIIQETFLKWHNTVAVTDDMMYAMGRVKFVLENYKYLKEFDYVHMLGSHDPLEKIFYRSFNSMDTGYPVKCALEGYELGKEPHKPDVIIDEFLNKELDQSTKELIANNVLIFRLLD